MAAEAAYGVYSFLEGAAALAKGIYDPVLPLKATLSHINDVDVLKAYHTISIVKGRAYLYGGKTHKGDGSQQQLADNDMHIVILPSSGVEGADFKCIPASSEAPPRRYGHSAAVIDDRIYVFGGSSVEDGEPLDESGRVWVFDTISNSWTHLDPKADSSKPEPRVHHASVATEHPQPVTHRTDEGTAPQLPPDPASVVPEPPAADSYGTIIVQGGPGRGGSVWNDMWAFDISSRTWTELPDPPPPVTKAPSLAMVDRRLYTFSEGQTSHLDLSSSGGKFSDKGGEQGLSPLGPWSTLPPVSGAPDVRHPGERTGATLLPVTTGQGRNYLLLVGGSTPSGDALEDIWALQLKPEGNSAAALKDAARTAIKKDTREMAWEEVKYYDAEGKMVQESQEGRGVGVRKGFAAARGTEVDGASVVVWGGVGADGKVQGNGLMATVDR